MDKSADDLEVGQVWETANVRRPRCGGSPGLRLVEITAVGETHAEVTNIDTGHRTLVARGAFSGSSRRGYSRST